MIKFDAGSFSDLANTSEGISVWDYLNSEEALACFETTTFLKRPALEGIQPKLMAKFSDVIISDRWKQMIGRMTRQIMESKGYTLDQTGVRTRVGTLFTSASRYKKLS